LSKLSDAKKTALSYYTNTASATAIGLLVNPLLLGALGPVYFGAWKATQRFLDVGSTANGGAAQALKWVLAHRSKNSTDDAKRRDVGAAIRVLLYWSPVLIAVTAIVVVILPFLQSGLPAESDGMIYLTGSILGLNVILMAIAAIPTAVLTGVNQGFRSMNITTAIMILTNAGMVGAAIGGLGLSGMATAVAIGTVANGGLTYLVLRRRVSWWGVARPHKDDLHRLSRFSGWVLGWSFVWRLTLATEVIVLSVVGGVILVSRYTFTSYAILFALSICQLTTSSLMPKLGALLGSGDLHGARVLAREVRELNLALATAMGGTLILVNGAFVTMWAGADQFMGQPINIVMVLAFVQLVIILNDAQIIDTGIDIGRKVALGAVMTVGTLAVAAVAFHVSNSIVVMYVAIIAIRFSGSIGFPIIANSLTQTKDWPYGPAAASFTILGASILTAEYVEADAWYELIFYTIAAVAVFGLAVFFIILSGSTRRKLRIRLK
jgi:O-antigen/teichoic acid export membrane protein